MKFHWKVLMWMVLGVILGIVLQKATAAPAWAGAEWEEVAGGRGLVLAGVSGPVATRVAKSDLAVGDRITAAIRNKGSEDAGRPETRYELTSVQDFQEVLPLMTELGKKSIMPRHWQQVMDRIREARAPAAQP